MPIYKSQNVDDQWGGALRLERNALLVGLWDPK